MIWIIRERGEEREEVWECWGDWVGEGRSASGEGGKRGVWWGWLEWKRDIERLLAGGGMDECGFVEKGEVGV